MADARVPEPGRVYTIPAGESFVDALAAGLLARAGGDPASLADALVLLPNRRACRALGDAFLRQGEGRALLLPRLAPIGDVDEDDLDVAEAGAGFDDADLAPAIAPLRRQFLLARLLARAPALGAHDLDRAVRLAAELARLLDDAQIAGVDLARLGGLAPEAYAAHWQKSLRFLEILTLHWPRMLAAEGRLDPADRRNRLLARLAATWRAQPPRHPVVAAGSTGSIPATADLLAAVAALPTGMVVLPGLDTGANAATWEAIGDSHPQAGLKRLLDRLGLARERVVPWPGTREHPRARLLADALRPAATIAAWRELPPPQPAALAGLARIEAPTRQVEAGVIALAMRARLQTPGASAALVTRDRGLARRVAEELGRFGLSVDDSAGQSLAATPPGAFLRLSAAMAAADAAPVPLLALLKHPLAAGGRDPARFRTAVRGLERAALRGPRPAPGFKGVAAALALAKAPRALRGELGRVRRAAAPFVRALGKRKTTLDKVLEAHVRFAEWLAATDASPGAERLWAREAGQALAAFVAEVADSAGALGRIRGADYPSLLETLLAGRVVRPSYGRHPRLAIWGPLEARLQHADLMILGGLEEGSSPPLPDPDPWLSRPMREALGLPARERRIGQAAHDFVQAAAGPEAMLTSAAKVDGSPTVPSRWLVRLETYLALHGRDRDPAEHGRQFLVWQANLDRPARVSPLAPPAPAPPVPQRPRALSVTAIETWLRDPYAVYARNVLRLRRLDPVDADPGAAERGQFIHDALDRFVAAYPDALPDDAYDRLLAFGDQAFGAALERPSVRAFWWPRFARIARWFVDQERERRADLVRVVSEIEGRLELAAPGGPFVVRAKADRIDVFDDGRLAVIDYKTGTKPTLKDAQSGLAPQLPLEAAIAGAGGFDGVNPGAVAELAFWHLTGDDPPAEMLQPKGDPQAMAEAALAGLGELVGRFDRPETPYLACPRPALMPRYNDYEHLERREEWEAPAAAVPAYRSPLSHRPGPQPPPRPEQRRMSDPATSAWITASAGTGKTKVLTDRVLRLLLGGAAPGRVLSLTFTKAAAAEMATRIEHRLGHWAIAAPEDLAVDLAALTGQPASPETVARARRLFAEVLEAPGGLPILTIHSFCQAVLARFPVEAEIAPGFEIADERTASELQAEALDRVIGHADAKLGLHVAVVARLARDVTVRDIVKQIVAARGRFAAALARHADVPGAIAALARMLGVAPGATVDDLVRATVDPAVIDEAALRAAATVLLGGSKTDRTRGRAIENFLALPLTLRIARFDAYRLAFLTKDETPRKDLVKSKIAQAHPRHADAQAAEADRLVEFVATRNRIATLEASAALWHFGDAVLKAYADRKRAAGVLDYEDLVLTTADLVNRPGAAPWVLYKLDGGIDHVLVDEAQDTSPQQWRIVAALVDEFFAGEGRGDVARTLFVVGDEKQSIFSFQGADLEGLARVHDAVRARAEAAQRPWLDLDMTLSYRSTATVLDAIDRVFAAPEARAGVADRPIAHGVTRAGPGLVEVWPLAPAASADAGGAWDVPERYVEAVDEPEIRLARHIAGTVAGWLDREPLESHGRAIRPGDVMVLLRRRKGLMHPLVRELRRRDVPVAGVDRMVLTEPLAVADLTALIEAALLPEDDLVLAAVLKGPFIGLDENELFALAAGRRRDERLWFALRRSRRGGRAAAAFAWLADAFAGADFTTPHGFLCAALNRPVALEPGLSGRAAVLARLGLEAEDPIDELLTQALAFERIHPPSLQGFVRWLGQGELEIARDLEHGRDEVRVITVHGAKGLEAPIVFLPDTTALPQHQGSKVLWLDGDEGLLWPGRAARAAPEVDQAKLAQKARELAEHRRLLYVALTRAADRLYVAGLPVNGNLDPGSWYALVRGALEARAEPFAFDAWPGQGLRLAGPSGHVAPERLPAPEADLAVTTALPPWLAEPVPAEPATMPPLAPSRGEDTPAATPIGAERDRRLRGRLIHRLLELLPELAPDARPALAARLADRLGAGLGVALRADAVAAALRLLDDPGLAALFGPGSRAEVPVVGLVGDRVVSGQIDRLVIAADEIVIADYKSDRAPPATAADVPEAYRRQLALYAALIRRAYPGRPVRSLLIWTEGPSVTELPTSGSP